MMFISDRKNFQDIIRPLIYFNLFIGVGAFRLPNQSRATYFLMKMYIVTFSLFNWIMIYITLNSLSQVIYFDNAAPMAIKMLQVLICVNSCITMIAPILLWLREKELRECFQQMETLDDTFQSVLGAQNGYGKQYISVICQIMAIFVAMIWVSITDSLWSRAIELPLKLGSRWIFISVLHTLDYAVLVMLMLDVNFCNSVRYLGKKFRDMNDSLLGLAEKSSAFNCPGEGRLFTISHNVRKVKCRNKVKKEESESFINEKHYLLREIRKAHLQLCKLCHKINFVFGIQNLLSTVISFVMITGLSYTIYSAFEWKYFTYSKLIEIFPRITWTAIYIFKILIVNHSCWSVSTEAERSGEVIYEILNSEVNRELRAEIQEFGVQMLQNPVRFNACGFFTLDYTFVQGVIGSITTYLVILIQMSQIYDGPSSGTALACNCTEFSTN